MGSPATANSNSGTGDNTPSVPAPRPPAGVNGTAPATEPIPTASEAEIDELRKEIDRLDAEILAAVKRRTEVSRIIGRTRMAQGGTRLVHNREMKVLERFSELGQEGHTLAMLLLRLGRGRLGH